MSHITGKSAYKRLEERLNRFPQGAPPSETLDKILQVLFNEGSYNLHGIKACFSREAFGG
ncbi:hypothetical protein [Alkaliphilus serpentinus]|uniref:Uncharacterized protein n=1 Tax=Alkaliphilus serpentinus TaxID=1482731 RepID=A0A833MA65_9FIRM|nr:hypothetical protein [Alkaliphilus serpentinus]KAB3531520.1 hypothetical protein F8153_04915 [Alkaliphilus serpentinus]